MASLARNLRKDLENAVKKARRVADAGARQVLEQLAVDHYEPWPALTPEQRKLRNRLRAHGRQLGDRPDERKGGQAIDRLAAQCAYEHWHRLLFARFLAENDLLVEPASEMALSLNECRELARERGVDWLALASDFAQRMLPQIFRVRDPVLEAVLPPEKRQELEAILESQPRDVFVADDSLGWVYQFWQAEQKDAVNKSGDKIGADELPAVTQLFTEDYMVDFLLDNTLGAWWAGKVLAMKPALADTAQSEGELRDAVALPGVEWKYLRFIKAADDKWKPAAGTFAGWPKASQELTCLDPCMGSGHFIVAMFERLVALRIAEEGLDPAVAVAAVIRDNLFGLEIDPRCTQIAAFNLALVAWRRVGHRPLPAMNLACSGLAPNTREADWLAIVGDDYKFRSGMERLYGLFKKAPVLGSLINPRAGDDDLLMAAFHELQPLLDKALAQETTDDTAHEMAVTARGLAKAAGILARQFTLVATNVPYLGQIWQSDFLRSWCVSSFESAKTDLAFVFLQRLLRFTAPACACAVVMPQGWLFQTSEAVFRAEMLVQSQWNFLVRIGRDAFESSVGADVLLGLFSNSRATEADSFPALDASRHKGPILKAQLIRNDSPITLQQLRQLSNRQSCIVLSDETRRPSTFLGDYVETIRGLSTGESRRFYRVFWELEQLGSKWEVLRETTDSIQDFGGMSYVILWEGERGELFRLADSLRHLNHAVQSWQRGKPYWGRFGVAINRMASLSATRYLGERFTENVGIIVPENPQHLPAVYSFCASPEFKAEVSLVNPKLDVEPRYLANVPFDLEHWQKVAADRYPNGLPKPFSSDPTQWLFNGHPAGAEQPLHVAVARLLGYQWPRQTSSSFPDCPALSSDGLEVLADNDGIVCIPAIKGEEAAAVRLRRFLAASFGADWSGSKLDQLLGQGRSTSKPLEQWLLQDFFAEHCALFHQRPFIWQVSDGLNHGFSALLNYHKLAAPNGEGKRTLEKLIYTYLGDWIDRQRTDQKVGIEGADGRVAAAENLRSELEKILEGEPPYDVFVRWKTLDKQPIGWEPDIDDGVRINIRPFMTAKPLNARGKNACILRVAPKIKWDKDRGKEPTRPKADFPWLWGWDERSPDFAGGPQFDGDRWNNLHYSRAVKLAARERAERGKS